MLSAEEAKSRVSQWVDQSKTLRIFVFGKLGAGKSTLINSLLNKEVAKVGSGLGAVTLKVEHFSGVVDTITSVPELRITIHNIDVTLWDTPGLQDPQVNREDILRDISTNISGNVDLYVYCHQMTRTRAETGDFEAIADLTNALGVNFWKRSFFALTFANDVTLPLSCTDQTLEQYFVHRVEDWKNVLHSAVLHAGVEKTDVEHIPVIPTSYYSTPLPISQPEGRWFTRFWSTCLERMRFMSIPALLTVNQEEWIEHEASDVIATRIITQRLMVLGDELQQQLEASLYEIPREDMWVYLKQSIRGSIEEIDSTVDPSSSFHSNGAVEVQSSQRSMPSGYVTVLSVVGVAILAICLGMLHSRR